MRQLIWFRNDLRIYDHAALSAALSQGPTIACFCLSVSQWRDHGMGDWRLAFLIRTLKELQVELEALNVPLIILDAPKFDEVPSALLRLIDAQGIGSVHFNDEYPLDERRRDDAVERLLRQRGIDVQRHVGDVIVAPGQILSAAGAPLTVFTPFYRKWREVIREVACVQPLSTPKAQVPLGIRSGWAGSVPRHNIDGVDTAVGAELWLAGERQAERRLYDFLEHHIDAYAVARDIPAVPGTSQLSAHLAVGAISARRCVFAALRHASDGLADDGAEKWISELAWRDFYRHIVAVFDHVSTGCGFRGHTDHLPWREAPEELAAWQSGQTGYPFVDAAMRQLNATGWMHNRLRMVSAMFLTKHLLIDWRVGERFFLSRLVDGDFASNNGGWQWSASTGTDAAPYFRIFYPATQGRRFDADGRFTKHWLPELAGVAQERLFEPGERGEGKYPAPIVEHRYARERALAFFKANL